MHCACSLTKFVFKSIFFNTKCLILGSIDVVSSAFDGQSAVNRQRMVYKVIWEELQTTVHAVDQMVTRTPTEAAGGGSN